jgi:hypothetical protein
MSRLQVPILGRTVQATGETVLRAELELLLRDLAGNWQLATFRADSASEMTTMSATEAKRLALPYPLQPVLGLAHHPTGLEVRSGYLRARVVGVDATEYAFPYYFPGDPTAPAPARPGRPLPANLLGLTGVIDQLRISYDGDAAPGAPYGLMTVEKK